MGNNSAAKMAMAKGSSEIKSADRVEELKKAAAQARDLSMEITSLEEELKDKKSKLYTMHTSTLPDMMVQLGFDHIGVPKEGNRIGIDFKLQKVITASIASSWDDEKKKAAFAVLKDHDGDAIIKTEVNAALPKGQLKLAKQLVAAAKKIGVKAELKQGVHSGTLGAWLRELYAGGKALSTKELEAIGGFVGVVVKPSERKEEAPTQTKG